MGMCQIQPHVRLLESLDCASIYTASKLMQTMNVRSRRMRTALVGLFGLYCPFCSKAAAAAAEIVVLLRGKSSGPALATKSSSSFSSCYIMVVAIIRVEAAACIVAGCGGQYRHSVCDQEAGIINIHSFTAGLAVSVD